VIRSSEERHWEVEAFGLLAHHHNGDLLSDLWRARTDELASELAIMVIAKRVVEAHVDVIAVHTQMSCVKV
jgi:hypothetical protein